MAKVILTAEECERFDKQTTEELRTTVERNERKRRKIKLDQKAYAEACRDLTSGIEAETDYALEVLEKRDLAAGVASPPGPVVKPGAVKKQKAKAAAAPKTPPAEEKPKKGKSKKAPSLTVVPPAATA